MTPWLCSNLSTTSVLHFSSLLVVSLRPTAAWPSTLVSQGMISVKGVNGFKFIIDSLILILFIYII